MKRIILTLIALVWFPLAVWSCGEQNTQQPAAEANNATAATQAATTEAVPAAVFETAKLGSIDRDVTYGKVDAVDLKMDVYYPQKKADGPWPVVVYVHGGGWTRGDKADGQEDRQLFTSLVDRGFLVVSVNYRLAPQYKFPAQIEDVKCAVRYLRANAGKYNLDPERIGAMGGSAGGHLVSLMGVTDGDEGLEGTGGNPDQSSRVQAVVDMFGPSDLTVEFEGGAVARQLGNLVFGATDKDAPILKLASPITHITADDPPFLILQGREDTLVPPSQSQELYDRLTAGRVPAQLVLVEHAGHGFKPVGGEPSPSRVEIGALIGDFFEEQLK